MMRVDEAANTRKLRQWIGRDTVGVVVERQAVFARLPAAGASGVRLLLLWGYNATEKLPRTWSRATRAQSCGTGSACTWLQYSLRNRETVPKHSKIQSQ
jgi:hypothetical protein